jgi:hypothetical protein
MLAVTTAKTGGDESLPFDHAPADSRILRLRPLVRVKLAVFLAVSDSSQHCRKQHVNREIERVFGLRARRSKRR